LCLLALAACSAPKKSPVAAIATDTPISDLNLVREEIPAALVEAQKWPYYVPDDQGCDAIAAEISALDEALGPDIDATVPKAKLSLVEEGASAVEGATVGAIRSSVAGVVPFRELVRELSGAKQYSKDVADAVVSGTVRRSFLKGIRAAKNCS